MNLITTPLTDEDIETIIIAITAGIDFFDDYIIENKCKPASEPWIRRSLYKDALEKFKAGDPNIQLTHVRLTICSLYSLKFDITEASKLPDITQDELDVIKETRRRINHSLRTFRAICEELGEDFDALAPPSENQSDNLW